MSTDSNHDPSETTPPAGQGSSGAPQPGAPAGQPAAGSPRGATAAEKFQKEVAAKRAANLEVEEEDEETLWSGGYTPKAMLGTWILMVIASVGLLVLHGVVPEFPLGIAVALIGLVWVFGCLLYAYRRLGFHYELTTQRFIHQTGLLSRQTDRIEVIDIDDVSFAQGPVQRMFGVGNIELTGSDRSHPNLSMIGIAKVKDVSGLIDDVRRKERRRRSLHIEQI
ncbi:Bacterial membrane flanked domain protein [Rubripirellula lacrimiformis]|uniref:Bacterial membrane flanked domain protein n=1 Tax=Rubripirellula lacrimiformis TaxID=1930273 RepID=A0A517N6S5_9BACT|nr:PH domain-containing protein [Rubripirellula lacrimiformis]QDT02843.1 Bacterial membrane flanked domain protein [Rubripirellula lacrimiformis]